MIPVRPFTSQLSELGLTEGRAATAAAEQESARRPFAALVWLAQSTMQSSLGEQLAWR
jgi:hypothetical protein